MGLIHWRKEVGAGFPDIGAGNHNLRYLVGRHALLDAEWQYSPARPGYKITQIRYRGRGK